MFVPLKYTPVIAVFGLMACQPTNSSDPTNKFEVNTLVEEIILPTKLSGSYHTAFVSAPRVTAVRFLDAYTDFAASGPVTRARLEDHARLRVSLERGQYLGHILAMDLNGDAQITPAELDAALSLPGWSNKPITIDGLFQTDENKDGLISLHEALAYSDILRIQADVKSLKPIESFFLLSDTDGDDIVTSDEIKLYLYDKLREKRRRSPQLRSGAEGALR